MNSSAQSLLLADVPAPRRSNAGLVAVSWQMLLEAPINSTWDPADCVARVPAAVSVAVCAHCQHRSQDRADLDTRGSGNLMSSSPTSEVALDRVNVSSLACDQLLSERN